MAQWRVIGLEHRHRRNAASVQCSARAALTRSNSSPSCLDLGVDRHGQAVRAEQRAVILLLPVRRRAPLPVEDRVGAMADGLPRHLARDSRRQRRVHRPPVHEGRLRLHHPEVLLLVAAHQVMQCAVQRRVEMAVREVVVPGSEVEVAMQLVVVDTPSTSAWCWS